MSNHISNTRKVVKEFRIKRRPSLERPLFILPSNLEEIMKSDDSTYELLNMIGMQYKNNPAPDYHAYTYLEPLKLVFLEEKVSEFYFIEEIYENYSPKLVEYLSSKFPTSELLYGDMKFGLYKRYDDFLEALKNENKYYEDVEDDEEEKVHYEQLIVRVTKYDFNSVFYAGSLEIIKKYNAMISKRITLTDGTYNVTEINPNLEHDICYYGFDFLDLIANYYRLYLDKARLVVVLNEGEELETTITFNFDSRRALRLKIAIDTLYTKDFQGLLKNHQDDPFYADIMQAVQTLDT